MDRDDYKLCLSLNILIIDISILFESWRKHVSKMQDVERVEIMKDFRSQDLLQEMIKKHAGFLYIQVNISSGIFPQSFT